MVLPPASIPVFPAGYGVLPSDMNSLVQSNFGFITNQIVFRAHQTGTQNYTAGTTTGSATIVQYDHVDEDPYSGWTGASSYLWTAPYNGWYEITVWNSISTAAVDLRSSILITGGGGRGQQFMPSQHQCSGSFLGGGVAYAIVSMVGGVDYVQGQCIITGVNASNDVSAIGRFPRIEIAFISQ